MSAKKKRKKKKQRAALLGRVLIVIAVIAVIAMMIIAIMPMNVNLHTEFVSVRIARITTIALYAMLLVKLDTI